jgi:hypothetical protein
MINEEIETIKKSLNEKQKENENLKNKLEKNAADFDILAKERNFARRERDNIREEYKKIATFYSVLEESLQNIEEQNYLLKKELINLKKLIPEKKVLDQLPLQNNAISKVKILKEHSLGKAWGSNTVNTVIFRHHAIFTLNQFQYTAFYKNLTTIVIIQRDLESDKIIEAFIKGKFNLYDAHNSISLGIDRDGYIHISYDHHATNLKYRCSKKPYSILEWSEELSMTGNNEDKVTYPTFILPRKNYPLTLLYRHGVPNKGTMYMKVYDEKKKMWYDLLKPILTGEANSPWTSSAYWNHPAFDKNGNIHLSFTWRTHYATSDKRVNNINIGYAKSINNGLTWVTSKSIPYKLPITQVNTETIKAISPSTNLINQTSSAMDSKENLHIVYYSNDEVGVPQYYHMWSDGSKWNSTQLTNRKTSFSLQGGGTLEIPMSRPEIVIDFEDNVFVLYRADTTNNKYVAQKIVKPYSEVNSTDLLILDDEDVGFSEPIIDRIRWKKENILTMYIQYSAQPNHDTEHIEQYYEAKLIDIKFKRN